MADQDYQLMKDAISAEIDEVLFTDGKLNLVATYYRINRQKASFPIYIQITELSLRKIHNTLETLRQNYEGYLLVDAHNNTLSSSQSPDNGFDQVLLASVANNPAQSIKIDGQNFYCIRLVADDLGIGYITYVAESAHYQRFNNYVYMFVLLTLAVLLATIIFMYNFQKTVYKPISELMAGYKQVEIGELNTSIIYHRNDEFKPIIVGFNQMVDRLKKLIDQVYVQKILVQRANLKQLQAQINPHFLFNCFFILKRRITFGELDAAAQLADHLGAYFQFITRTASDKISFAKEVEHARIYAQIQGMRFADRLTIHFESLPERYAHWSVERLILQPVIENAFEYGLEKKAIGGVLKISFREEGECVVICVEDNGEYLTDNILQKLQASLQLPYSQIDESIELTGLINIHRRLVYAMGNSCGLLLFRSKLGGLAVEVKLRNAEER